MLAGVGIRAPVEVGRQQREALEQRQQALAEARRRREALPRENAALEAEGARLAQELVALRRAVADARARQRRPSPSLPEQLLPPFHVRPSRRTLYGRLRFALRTLPLEASVLIGLGVSGRERRLALLGAFVLLGLWLRSWLQGPGDDSRPAWSFGEEGFSAAVPRLTEASGMRYADITRVEVRQGWLQRRFGFGSVRVTGGAAAPPGAGGKEVGQTVTLTLLDEPHRLAEWLGARAGEARHER